jgi:anti-anti-sigma regulatory factor
MLDLQIENIGDLAVIECEGRLVRSEAAFKLREAVLSQENSKTILLDLTEIYAIEGGGLGMLGVLQKWAFDRGIQFRLFNPTSSVRNRLEHCDWMGFQISSFDAVMDILAEAEATQVPFSESRILASSYPKAA